MIKGIVFDFDGTLANTLPVIFACYDYSTEKILGKKADRAPFIETFGLPLTVCLTKFLVKKWAAGSARSIGRIRSSIMMN